MLIDWFTVIAQAINFLILVWLLKRFLYRPILNAIDVREKHIAAELADADARKTEALAEREEFKRKNEEFDRQRAALQNKVTDEAATEHKRLFEDAQKDAEKLRAMQLKALENELQTLNAEIARRTQAEVFAIARHALADLAGTNLEEQMVEVFIRRLHELDATEKTRLTTALAASVPVLVRSAFELTAALRKLIEEAVKTTFASAELQVNFDIAPDLIGGIELVVQGRKVAWSIADYLASLDKDAGALLNSQRKEGTGSTAPGAKKENDQ